MNQGEVLDNLLHLLELEERGEAALTCQRGRESKTNGTLTERKKQKCRGREGALTVQTHVVEGEDGGPAAGP